MAPKRESSSTIDKAQRKREQSAGTKASLDIGTNSFQRHPFLKFGLTSFQLFFNAR